MRKLSTTAKSAELRAFYWHIRALLKVLVFVSVSFIKLFRLLLCEEKFTSKKGKEKKSLEIQASMDNSYWNFSGRSKSSDDKFLFIFFLLLDTYVAFQWYRNRYWC